MIRQSKQIVTLFLTFCCLFGSQDLFGIFDLPRFYAWKKEMLGKIQATFESIVPEEERRKWKSMDGDPHIGDINQDAAELWIPVNQSESKWTEKVFVGFICKPNTLEKKQFRDIEEAYEVQKKNYKRENAKWIFTKINDKEALIELDLENGTTKKIQRKIMSGDWLTTMSYEFKPPSEEDKKLWEQKRDLWIQRFQAIDFE